MISLILVVMGVSPWWKGTTGRRNTRCISTHRFKVWIFTNNILTVTVIFIALLACNKTGNIIWIVTDITNPIVTMVARFSGIVRVCVIQRLIGVRWGQMMSNKLAFSLRFFGFTRTRWIFLCFTYNLINRLRWLVPRKAFCNPWC